VGPSLFLSSFLRPAWRGLPGDETLLFLFLSHGFLPSPPPTFLYWNVLLVPSPLLVGSFNNPLPLNFELLWFSGRPLSLMKSRSLSSKGSLCRARSYLVPYVLPIRVLGVCRHLPGALVVLSPLVTRSRIPRFVLYRSDRPRPHGEFFFPFPCQAYFLLFFRYV